MVTPRSDRTQSRRDAHSLLCIGEARKRGTTIVEVLVVIGVLLVLTGLSMPVFSAIRERGRHAADLSKIRSLGASVVGYCNDHRDVVPTVFPLSAAQSSPRTSMTSPAGLPRVRGWWQSNAATFHLLLTPTIPTSSVTAAGLQPPSPTQFEGSLVSTYSDFRLADCLFAAPAYWDRATQAGPSQWGAQRLTDVRSPSLKGIMRQARVVSDTTPNVAVNVVMPGIKSVALWGDLSASIEVLNDLRPGVPDFFHSGGMPHAFWDRGLAIANTEQGIYGRDR